MGIPAFTGCTKGSYCSDQQATKVGNNQTQIYHRTVTTLTGTGPAYTGSKIETYIITKNAAGIESWELAATSTDGGKTQTFTSVAGPDFKKSMAPGGNMHKNIQAQVQTTLAKGGARQGLVTLPGTSGSLEKINPEQQKALGVVSDSTATGNQSGVTQERLDQELKTESDNTRNKFSQVLKYPRTLKSEYQDVIKFKMVQYRPRPLSTGGDLNPIQDRPPQNIIGVVTLPIPSGISDTNTATWNSNDLNPLKAMGVDIVQTGITQGLGAAANTAGQAATAVQGNSKTVQQLITSAFAESALGTQDLLSRTQGAVINPNMELLFLGPSLRPFTFTFKLSARTEEEAKDIRSIIRFFKQGMSPIRTKANLFLKAPHTFQIEYLHKNKPHTYLNKFKECALQSFTVDYTPEGQYATFLDGAMVSYQITMQFQELEPIFNDDYKNSENNPDTEIGY